VPKISIYRCTDGAQQQLRAMSRCQLTSKLEHRLVVSDCPRGTAIRPQNACQAGVTLTCTSRSYPAAGYLWMDDLNGGAVVATGQSYTLPAGPYNLTCVAYMFANCSNGYYSPVPFPDGVTAEGFPFDGLLNRTGTNTTTECSDNATVAGYAIGE